MLSPSNFQISPPSVRNDPLGTCLQISSHYLTTGWAPLASFLLQTARILLALDFVGRLAPRSSGEPWKSLTNWGLVRQMRVHSKGSQPDVMSCLLDVSLRFRRRSRFTMSTRSGHDDRCARDHQASGEAVLAFGLNGSSWCRLRESRNDDLLISGTIAWPRERGHGGGV